MEYWAWSSSFSSSVIGLPGRYCSRVLRGEPGWSSTVCRRGLPRWAFARSKVARLPWSECQLRDHVLARGNGRQGAAGGRGKILKQRWLHVPRLARRGREFLPSTVG